MYPKWEEKCCDYDKMYDDCDCSSMHSMPKMHKMDCDYPSMHYMPKMHKMDCDCSSMHYMPKMHKMDCDMGYEPKMMKDYDMCCDMPKMPCKMEKKCVKTYKCIYKLYKTCHYRLYKVCPRCGHEFDYHHHRGMCPRCD